MSVPAASRVRCLRQAPAAIEADTVAVVFTLTVPRGGAAAPHAHPYHQLCWSPVGVYELEADDRVRHLSPTTALWVPAGVEHRFWSPEPMLLLDAKFAPSLCPLDWAAPTAVGITPLVAALIGHLADDELAGEERTRAEAVLFDALRAARDRDAVSALVPRHPHARTVAEAVLRDPADDRSLEVWASRVGSSRRTLSRAFRDGTGRSFTDWRSQTRMQIAAARLHDGLSVGSAARHVGYRDTGAFIAAFRRVHGVTPGRHVADRSAGDAPRLTSAGARRRPPRALA